MEIIYYFNGLFVLAIINAAISSFVLRRFLSDHRAIQTVGDLDDFKKVARMQMYQALAQIVFLVGMLLVGLYGLFNEAIGLIWVILLNLIIMAIGQLSKKTEEKVRSLDVPDDNLAIQYDEICETWLHKPFPDF